MASITTMSSIKQCQDFIRKVYNKPNDRHFELSEMHTNIQRFGMRGLKGIRKGDIEKIKLNLIISFGWFTSTLNRLHIDLEDEVWKRFPYLCSYCGSVPCCCSETKPSSRPFIIIDNSKRPGTLSGFQKMFNQIYPPSSRTLNQAGIHLAEEIGEFSEALIAYRGERSEQDFKEVLFEAADYFSCLMSIFNSLGVDLSEELAAAFYDNCHVCKAIPCTCPYVHIKNYKV